MADPWLLRAFKGRSSGPPTPTTDKCVFDETTTPFLDGEADMTRPRESSRVSSFLGFVRQNSALSGSNSESFTTPSFNVELNNPGQTWHNPNPYQVAENLKVVMMTQSSFDPVPVKHNGSILQVLESYQEMCLELKSKDKEIEKLKADHAKEINALHERILDWQQKEVDYQTEMKKLEVMLATGQRGLDLVTMARTNSVLNRSHEKMTYKKGSRSNENDGLTPHQGHISDPSMRVDYSSSLDRQVSAKLESRRRILEETRVNAKMLQPTCEAEVLGSKHSFSEQSLPPADLLIEKPQEIVSTSLNQQQEDSDNASSMSSDSSFEDQQRQAPSCEYHKGEYTPLESFSIQGISTGGVSFLDKKPLPNIPSGVPDESFDVSLEASLEAAAEKAELLTPFGSYSKTNTSSVRRKGFSFVPGDDLYEFAQIERSSSKATRQTLQTSGDRNYDPHRPLGSLTTGDPSKKLRMKNDGEKQRHFKMVGSDSSGDVKASISTQADERPALPTRDNSSSSVVTAIRDNSSRTSRDPDIQGQGNGERSQLDKHLSSNDAIIAATRAIAGKEKKEQRPKNLAKGLGHSPSGDRSPSVRERAEQFNAGMRKPSNN